MMTPSANSSEPTRDADRDPDAERTVGSEPAVPTGRPADPEVPEADALDQAREVLPGERFVGATPSPEVSEADALEQALEEPVDDEDLNG
jgi:hypothetical protein